jgi:hypothetical protein
MYKGFKVSHASNSKLRIVCVTNIARAIPDDGALNCSYPSFGGQTSDT